MARYFCLLAAVCVAVSGAPPAPPRLYQQQSAPAHLQSIGPLDYFSENSEVSAYYNQAQAQQKQVERVQPARLENLENPDSEVELIPGAQQPQQPPQTPVSPNLPGLVPGQRVFIVHMPVPGYRPGTIGGYQPIYIVAAAPQGNNAYAGNAGPGYQNAVLVNPGAPGQVVNPFFGFPAAQAPGGLVVGGPLGYRGFEQVYQPQYQPQIDPAYGFQPGPGPQPEGPRGAVHLSQLVGLQAHAQPPHPGNQGQRAETAAQTSDPKRVGEASESVESKEPLREEPRRNARPTPAHAQPRNKA
ncbi:translation initiation factor IF-2-like [Pectinophora gossypiella]|uniref:translation initiation factor IF-2-like n=1 Tax=Pectinophora gossypiella TaxID=13191 RepID=UPI00214F508F|nr:translation initiation factor IF-2-like [Pectinophora gossypiella]